MGIVRRTTLLSFFAHFLFFSVAIGCTIGAGRWQQDDRNASPPAPPLAGGTPVIADDALLTTAVGGLERTQATSEIVPVTGQPFAKALRVRIGTAAPETNATQMTVRTTAPVQKGDALLASFHVRGAAADGNNAGQVEFLFERATDPWTKSATRAAVTPRGAKAWRQVVVPFTSAESYAPGEAMISLRFAFGPQTVEVGGLSLINYGKTKTAEELIALAASQTPLGDGVRVAVNLKDTKQTMMGFGGNFAQPRYGKTEAMDPVGQYNLDHLRVVHARVGIPLNWWTPEKGAYKDQAQAKASFLAMQEFSRRKIPIVASIWEGPIWMLGGKVEQSGRTLPQEKYADCIEAVARYLVTARDKYGVSVDYVSFNEPDYGVNFKFTPAQMADFIRQAGPRFQALGLKTKFVTADTANASNFADYARPLLEDTSIAPYLGPLAFHSWDALGAPDARYAAIAAVGKRYGKPVWCLEAGHDAQLWQAQNPWVSWENGLRTALAYEKTIRLTGASLMDYWTYQDNYPLVTGDGKSPYPVFHVLRQMEEVFAPGAKVTVPSVSGSDELRVLATVGAKKGTFSVLLVNPVGAGTVTVAGLPSGTNVSVVQSTADGQRKTVGTGQRVSRAGELTVSLPSRSIITLLAR